MKVMGFEEASCLRALRRLDSYVSNELPVETAADINRHLEACQACATELETRLRLRTRLKEAVRRESVPACLEAEIGSLIRERIRPGRSRWAIAAAGLLAVAASGYLALRLYQGPGSGEHATEFATALGSIAESLSPVMRVGFADHMHCALLGSTPEEPHPAERVRSEMGPAYAGLAEIARGHLPAGLRLMGGHRCTAYGRRYVHLVAKDPRHMLSVVITGREPDESLDSQQELPVMMRDATPVFRQPAREYEIAALETREHLVYFVSDLSRERNLEAAGALATPVKRYLERVEQASRESAALGAIDSVRYVPGLALMVFRPPR